MATPCDTSLSLSNNHCPPINPMALARCAVVSRMTTLVNPRALMSTSWPLTPQPLEVLPSAESHRRLTAPGVRGDAGREPATGADDAMAVYARISTLPISTSWKRTTSVRSRWTRRRKAKSWGPTRGPMGSARRCASLPARPSASVPCPTCLLCRPGGRDHARLAYAGSRYTTSAIRSRPLMGSACSVMKLYTL